MKKLLIIMAGLDIATSLNAQIGKVGINTTTPAALLHVKDSSVLFSGAANLPVTPGNPPASGAGVRMMWYPDKAAFRVGRVTGLNWDKDSIGVSSFAIGFNSKATKSNSTALGNSSFANGTNAFAAGHLTMADGTTSTALGRQTQALGNYSTATGYLTVSSGVASFAAGEQTTANFDYATSFGFLTTASGQSSLATGLNTLASGQSSFAGGYGSFAGGHASSALGFETNATGSYAMSIGDHTTASGESSLAIGKNTSASGSNSASAGFLSSASGSNAFAIGSQVIAMGNESVAMGNLSLADGLSAFAMGSGARARGDYSIALGNNTYAKAFASVAIGQYNDTTNMVSTDSWVLSDPVFVIGNGVPGFGSNILTVYKNGKISLNISSPPQAMLDVNGTVKVGSAGTALNEIIKKNVLSGPHTIPALSSLLVTLPTIAFMPESAVYISPSQDLPDGLIIAYVKVNQTYPHTISFKFVNTTGVSINIAQMEYYVGIIR